MIDTDYGYLWPVLSKLAGGAFAPFQGVNFLYPGAVYGLTKITGDFRVVTVVQHLLGLAAGGLFWLVWQRLELFLPPSKAGRRLHLALGLVGLGTYLLSTTPIWLEARLRPDAVCMFFELWCCGLAVEALVQAEIFRRPRLAFALALLAGLSAILLAALKPSFLLSAAFLGALLVVFTARVGVNAIVKIAGAVSLGAAVFAISATQTALTRNDENTQLFLPRTLFLFQAPMIVTQMERDLAAGIVPLPERARLAALAADLRAEIARLQRAEPGRYPVLGYNADGLVGGPGTWYWRLHGAIGGRELPGFFRHWYWRSLREQPLAFARKMARQMGVFYRWDCPAFHIHRRLPVAYASGRTALGAPTTVRLLPLSAAGRSLAAQSMRLQGYEAAMREPKLVGGAQRRAGARFLALMLLTLATTPWLVRAGLGRAVGLLLVLYALVAGNVLSIAAIHSMEVSRYSEVLFLVALLAHLWALRCCIAGVMAASAFVRPESSILPRG